MTSPVYPATGARPLSDLLFKKSTLFLHYVLY